MAFSDHKIAAFAHKITDLPDQPNLPADELKARFDSSPEELRVAHNALCDDADRLDDRVSGIIAETFGDAIPKSMLADELQDEIDAKAEAADLTAETTARESADSALSTRVTSLESTVPQKAQVYRLRCTGTGDATKTYTFPFAPDIVFSVYDDCGRVSPNAPLAVAQGTTVIYNTRTIAARSNSTLTLYNNLGHNESGRNYTLIAIA